MRRDISVTNRKELRQLTRYKLNYLIYRWNMERMMSGWWWNNYSNHITLITRFCADILCTYIYSKKFLGNGVGLQVLFYLQDNCLIVIMHPSRRT
jgi:hypothetical protein